jgi:DNA-binding transcriptional LysR family regulator
MTGDLPIHKHLRTLGVVARPSFEVELRCALCAGRERCARRATPLADCPNAVLLRKEPSGTIAAPKA